MTARIAAPPMPAWAAELDAEERAELAAIEMALARTKRRQSTLVRARYLLCNRASKRAAKRR